MYDKNLPALFPENKEKSVMSVVRKGDYDNDRVFETKFALSTF